VVVESGSAKRGTEMFPVVTRCYQGGCYMDGSLSTDR